MWLIKALLIIVFFIILYQDYKDRLVYWFLYPLVGFLAFALHVSETTLITALLNSLINIIFITLIILGGYIYSAIVARKKFINTSIGIGDILLFVFLSFTFATSAFITMFVFSLLFSLILHFVLKSKSSHKNVPLAGYISLFFAIIYFISFFLEPRYLYA